jgi:TIR domain
MEESEKIVVFISHISEEQVEANKAKDYLEQVFPGQLDVFVASSWMSIPPGDDWFSRIGEAISRARIMLVLCSSDSVSRPWIQFECGAAWFSKNTKVIPVCHKGYTLSSLPEPIKRLQGIDINAGDEAQRLQLLAAAVRVVADLPQPTPISAEALAPMSTGETNSSIRGWVLRPTAHIGKKYDGVFKVGTVSVSDPDRAREAGLDPSDSLYIRLYLEPANGIFINTVVAGDVASIFEADDIEGKVIKANIRLAAVHVNHTDGRSLPIIVVDSAQVRPG